MKVLDMCTMSSSDQDFTSDFELTLSLGATAPATVHALVLWFDTDFTARHCSDHAVKLSTSPQCTTTHWAQTVLALPTPVRLAPPGSASLPADAAATVTGRLTMTRNKGKHRMLDIVVEASAKLGSGEVVTQAQLYAMEVGGE